MSIFYSMNYLRYKEIDLQKLQSQVAAIQEDSEFMDGFTYFIENNFSLIKIARK